MHESTPSNSVPDDLTCAVCGYALRGLNVDSSCPECGYKVNTSHIAASAMTKRELVKILCQVMGLWFLVIALSNVGSLAWIAVSFDSDWWVVAATQGASILLMAAVGLLLWFRGNSFARRIIQHDGRVGPGARMTGQTLIGACVFLLGLWLAVEGLIGFIDALIFEIYEFELTYAEYGNLVEATTWLIQIFIGGGLMFGLARWVALWQKLQPEGSRKG